MGVRSIEPIDDRNDSAIKRPGRLRSVRQGSGGGGDSSRNDNASDLDKNSSSVVKSRIILWCLLSIVLMTFGGLIAAYIVISNNAPIEWKPMASLPTQVWISTALIVSSSFTFHISVNALINQQHMRAKRLLLATTVLGGAFISSQLVVWIALVNRGLYMRGNPYVGFFYILTAVHAVHVIGGIVALVYILLRTSKKARSQREVLKRIQDAKAIGWYWHTMGGLWLVLLFLLAFWK